MIKQTILNLYRTLKYSLINFRGNKVSSKIVVFESDDWGGIRTPSKEVKNKFINSENEFSDYLLKMDTLETIDDINRLFSILNKYKDSQGNKPIITANFAVCNPNFDEIDIENKKYSRETIDKTYKKYYGTEAILFLFKKGIENKVFLPQLHCLEHLNIHRWMEDLYNNIESTVLAFENNMVGIQGNFTKDNRFAYMDELHCTNSEENLINCNNIAEGLNIFEEIFGYKSESFTASCHTWTKENEKTLKDNNVFIIQTGINQFIPVFGSKKLKKKKKYFGLRKNGLFYSLRNCYFEPAINDLSIEENISMCLKQIDIAFKMKKPAIISVHRVNFVSSIDNEKYEKCIKGFDLLLQKIVEKYNDVLFMNTVDMCKYVLKKENKYEKN